MSPDTFKVSFQESWHERGTTHHIGLPPHLMSAVKRWAYDYPQIGTKSSITTRIFANEKSAGQGALNFESGYLTGVKRMFKALSIDRANQEQPELIARLSFDEMGPIIRFGRLGAEIADPETLRAQSPLLPFSEKSEDAYLVDLKGSLQNRGKKHEQLVNRFARWLAAIGYVPKYSRAIDLALLEPLLLIEAKFVSAGKWTECVRGAVAQLHEYRWFIEGLRNANLLFLSSEPVPEHWRVYLKDCHGIRSAWPDGDTYQVEDLDLILPLFTAQRVGPGKEVDYSDSPEEQDS